MPKFASLSMIKKLILVAVAGVILSACANTMEGVGKDMQTMGNSMGGAKPANPNTNNQSQTQGKDVVITPIK